MRLRITDEIVEALRATPQLQASSFSVDDWTGVERRIKALNDLLAGATVSAVATRHSLDRKTVARLFANAVERAPDGERYGYRACIPNKRFAPPTPQGTGVPAKAHAFAFEMVVRALPAVADVLHEFKGSLPSRSTPSPAFNRLYNSIVKLLTAHGYAKHYPLNTSDGGRRAMQAYLKRHRARREFEEGAERPEAPSITRVENLFPLQPFDRFEFDEHPIDIDAWIALPLTDGTFQLEHIDHLWLLGMWDVGSGAAVAGSLVIGRKYNSDDVCELVAKSLTSWAPRELIIPGMRYSERAWMPGLLAVDGIVPRALQMAADNDATHLSNMTRDNVTEFRMGMSHYARAGNAEDRGTVESRFRRFSNEVARYIAGGYIPETDTNERMVVSTLRGERYPILPEALDDLLDTYLSASNVSDRSARDPRTPKQLIEQYAASGALLWRCPGTPDHVRRMTVRRMEVRISGSKPKGVPPLVYCDHARYRSPQLSGQWSLVGQLFRATYENPSDIRELTLWDRHGAKLFTLHALPPYAAVPHSFKIRQRAAAWARANRALPRQAGEVAQVMGDNVLAYHEAVRASAGKLSWASGYIASGDVPATSKNTSPVRPTEAPLAGFRPLLGTFRLR